MRRNLFFSAIIIMFAAGAQAQVTIGSLNDPQPFSILELESNSTRGMRLPQMTAAQREALNLGALVEPAKTKAMGLQIFNTTTGCVETWNGEVWISVCIPCTVTPPSQTSMVFSNTSSITAGDYPQFRFYRAAAGGEPLPDDAALEAGDYYISAFVNMYCESSRTQCTVSFANPVVTIPVTQGGGSWNAVKWVGAFWRDDQTGERIIASQSSGNWVAEIEDEDGAGSWLTLDGNGGYDPNIWTAAPGDAEDYQFPFNRVTRIQGSGNILFRIGAISKNTSADADYDTGNRPRYARVTVTVNSGAQSTIYCRQGESADYVFSPSDNFNGGTGSGGSRNLAVRFSPYNLTDRDLTESILSHATGINGGTFVDRPTKAGAFWQWGVDKSNAGTYAGNIRRAYHPSNPPGGIYGWDRDYIYPESNDTWNKFTGSDRLETCPQGWRRPTVGDTVSLHDTQTAGGSELMQSLFYTTFDSSSGNNLNINNHRYFGYYADGYFDRLPITVAVGYNGSGNSAVSASTVNVAMDGILYTNPNTGASLFIPAAGYRHDTEDGRLNGCGGVGRVWSSSAANENNGWLLDFDRSSSNQNKANHSDGFTVRCIREK
ncbi:MAG: hypothetical protein LBJ17_07535 [Dysgonamonadaceae bacterium]|jgi:hypothetical protein|nr:hypothetical protein [Dysgonamonadaceae bacterium]